MCARRRARYGNRARGHILRGTSAYMQQTMTSYATRGRCDECHQARQPGVMATARKNATEPSSTAPTRVLYPCLACARLVCAYCPRLSRACSVCHRGVCHSNEHDTGDTLLRACATGCGALLCRQCASACNDCAAVACARCARSNRTLTTRACRRCHARRCGKCWPREPRVAVEPARADCICHACK